MLHMVWKDAREQDSHVWKNGQQVEIGGFNALNGREICTPSLHSEMT